MIETVEELEALYGEPKPASTRKVADRIIPVYRTWIDAARFCVLTTVGPDGTDGSPRGDDGPVVTEIDPGTLAMPDWRGNNRMDSLRNIVSDGRVSLMFMVPGSTSVVRINGTAKITTADDKLARFFGDDALAASLTDLSHHLPHNSFVSACSIPTVSQLFMLLPVSAPSVPSLVWPASSGT